MDAAFGPEDFGVVKLAKRRRISPASSNPKVGSRRIGTTGRSHRAIRTRSSRRCGFPENPTAFFRRWSSFLAHLRRRNALISSRPAEQLSAIAPVRIRRVSQRHALRQAHFRISGKGGAADLPGINPGTLASRLKALGIDRRDYVK